MYYFQTHKGQVRERNEDNCDIFNVQDVTFMMVLDGMGGHNKGDTASSLAMKIIKERLLRYKKFRSTFFLRQALIRSIKRANREVNKLGSSLIEYADMGTTIILAAIYKNKVIVCNVGDSSCYFYNDDKLVQISEDQTYVEFLYKTGKITYEEKFTHPKKHILMNALGTYPTLSIATKIYKKKLNKILLCSDGLYNMVDLEYIERILQKDISTQKKVEELVNLSNLNGGKDNIAIALWEDKQ